MNQYHYTNVQPSGYNLGPPATDRDDQHHLVQHGAGLAQASYENNRSLIPGLGLGFQSSVPSDWARVDSDTNPSLPAQPLHTGAVWSGNGGNGPSASKLAVGHHYSMVEDDLSEGELEDIYEPVADEAAPRSHPSEAPPGASTLSLFSPNKRVIN